MSILHPLSQAEIRANFSHYGLMFGCVPVYVGQPDSEAPVIAVRNGWPDWLLDAAHGLFVGVAVICQWVNPHFEPCFWFELTGPIEGASGSGEGASG